MARRVALTELEKEYIRVRKQAGESSRALAQALGCSVETVKKWWGYQRRGFTPRPVGRPARGILSTYTPRVVEAAIRLKRNHPHWGPANVRLELKRELQVAEDNLPSLARLSVLFKARCPEAIQPRRRRAYADHPPSPVTRPHQRWQMDGKEKVRVGDQEVATLLTIRDPAGALMIACRALLTTTPKGWRKVTLDEVRSTLRTAFSEWGLPLEVQTDHEVVYTGSPAADFPSHFTLWLVGLSLTHLTSRERRPTDQPQVERTHRTLGDMAWKDEPCDTVEQLQDLLDDRRWRYHHELPVQAGQCHGQPPLVVYPWATHSGRPYHPDLEWQLFDLARVDAFLAQFVWTRLVNDSGCAALGNHLYYVGRALRGQTVAARFLPDTRAFCFQLPDGQVVRCQPAVGLDQADLIGFIPLEVSTTYFQLPLPLCGV